MPRIASVSTKTKPAGPDYAGLVNFLIKPFLEAPDSLIIDCEQLNQKQRVWVRVAFAETDKGRVYGRGGRNIQGIRTVLQTTATLAGQLLYLDIYGEPETQVNRAFYPNREPQDNRGFRPDMRRRGAFRSDRDSSSYSKPPTTRFRRTRPRSQS
jgi:predicted RNA-binding protein YlqC (UPF0109 family)